MVLLRERTELPNYILQMFLKRKKLKNQTCILIELTFNVMSSTSSYRQNGK